MKVILKALTQIVPNSNGIEAPSRIEAPVEMSPEALASFADTGRAARVSLKPDGISNPQNVTAYTLPAMVETESGEVDIWPCRYIVTGKKPK